MNKMDIRLSTFLEREETIDGRTFGFDEVKSSIEVSGRVWIGDPCYPPFFNKNWNNGWLGAYWGGELALEKEDACTCSIVVTVNGIEMVAGGTDHGDGCYQVSSGGEVGVDAGLLCVIPESMFELAGLDGKEEHGGVYLDDVHGTAYINEDGTLHAGSVNVITKERCECCGDAADDCHCERCDECGEWEDYCMCCGVCEYYECQCEDEEDEDDE